MAELDRIPFALVEQQRRNLATRDNWQSFATHRERVTALLLGVAPPKCGQPVRLCVLGAGNCNDLDLAQMVRHFDRVHLVDWDATALAEGVSRQGLGKNPGILLHGRIDLAGLTNASNRWCSNLPVEEEEVAPLLSLVRTAPSPALGEQVDVVASVCLLSQLLEGLIQTIGPDHPRLLEFVQSMRRRHLEMLVELLTPGGIGLLITDVVSSDTSPQLLTAQDFELNALVASLINRQNFFTGLNPAVLLNLLTTDPQLSGAMEEVTPIAPWRWNLGPRIYVVYAIQFRRRQAALNRPAI